MTKTNSKTNNLVQIRGQLASTMSENVANNIHLLGESENKLKYSQLTIETRVSLRFQTDTYGRRHHHHHLDWISAFLAATTNGPD